MSLGKSIAFTLSAMLINATSLFSQEGNSAYDIEMFTFYPYHCESTLMRQMKKVFQCDTFVETGTYDAITAFCASSIFDQVLSVELSSELFSIAQSKNVFANVSLYQDSSDQFLIRTIPTLRGKTVLYWLDAHYSSGNTATLIDDTSGLPKSPIYGELTAIFKNGLGNSVVLIDDISGYLLEQSNDMRYPHLHQQYHLIQTYCPTAKLYVVGDLAMVYDSAYQNPSISPIVQACTTSRMFDWYASTLDEERAVLEAEYDLVVRCAEKEASRICYLSGYCHCRDYRLWRGLIHLGRSDFAQAAEDFRFVMNQGLTHWRVEFYLAYALAKTNADQAQEIFLKLKSHLQDHADFLKQAYPN